MDSKVRRFLILISLETSVTFCEIYDILGQESNESAIVILIPQLLLFIVKMILLKSDFKHEHNILIVCLLCQSIEFGVLELVVELDTQFLQCIELVQYMIVYYPDRENIKCIATLLILYCMLPQVLINTSTPMNLITIFCLTILTLGCIYLTKAPIDQIQSPQNECEVIILEQTTSKPDLIQKLLDQLYICIVIRPFLEQQKLIILNHALEIVYDQCDLKSVTDLDNSSDSEILKLLFKIKPESISNTLQQCLQLQQVTASRKSQPIDIKSILETILQQQPGRSQYYSVAQFGSMALKFHPFKLNIIPIVQEQTYIVLHFEEPLSKTERQMNSYVIKSQSLPESMPSQQLSNIFSSISHEFGTFLNCIQTACSESIRDPFVPVDIKDYYLTPISINAKLLQYTLFNIRDFNSILLQQFQLRLEEFKPYEQLQEVIQLVSEPLEQRNNELIVKCPVGLVIYNDSDRFKQVIYQLLSNAIRFTQDGIIQVEIIQINDSIRIKVTDTGIGMNPSEQDRLNILLKDSSQMIKISQNSVGCGLGLSISNAIVNYMDTNNGSISFTSSLEQGSEFQFTIHDSHLLYNNYINQKTEGFIKAVSETYYIQYQQKSDYKILPSTNELQMDLVASIGNVDQNDGKIFKLENSLELNSHISPIKPNSIPVLHTNLKQHILEYTISSTCCSRVMIIDDEYFNIMSIQMILKKFNTITDRAFNGQQALTILNEKLKNPCPICRNRGYAIYFIDLNMPVMDGFDTVRELKIRMSQAMIPKGLCIANTGFSDLVTKRKAMSAGMDIYLTKPIQVNDLECYLKQQFKENI